MNRTWCKRESDVVQAVRAGLFSSELHEHVLRCTICTETRAVTTVMLQAASLRGAEDELPAAGLVWRRAETRKKELALRRATRPLIFMRALGVVYVVLSAAWLLHSFWRPGFMGALYDGGALLKGTACFAAVASVILIAIGVGYLLNDSRRSSGGVPSA